MKLEIEFTDEQRQEAINMLHSVDMTVLSPAEKEKAKLLLTKIDSGEVDNRMLYEYYVRCDSANYVIQTLIKKWLHVDELLGEDE